MLELDHLAVAGESLEAAVAHIEDALGVQMLAGRHTLANFAVPDRRHSFRISATRSTNNHSRTRAPCAVSNVARNAAAPST